MTDAKKSLLPLALLGLCGAVHAQSPVQVYGIADVGLAHSSGSRSSSTQVASGGMATSRLGFRAIEDLGGGMSAAIGLEAGLNLDTGAGQATNTNNQPSGTTPVGGLTFNRRSTISLLGSWGEVRVGRDYVPQYSNFGVGDPMGLVGPGVALNYAAVITGVTAARASNMVTYFTPNTLGGFGLSAARYRGENAGGTAASDDGNGGGVRLTFERGPFFGGIATGQTNYATGNVRQQNIAAAWNLGVAKLMGTYNNDRNGTLEAKGAVAGVAVPVGSGEIKAAYSFHRTNAASRPEGKKVALAYIYYLSKRTALYANVARLTNHGGSALAIAGAGTAPNTSSTGAALGLRQNF
jgi:predicted porin